MNTKVLLTCLTSTLILLAFQVRAEEAEKNTVTQSAVTTIEKMVEPADLDNVMDAYVPSPKKVAKAQFSENKRIQYMVDNYTLPQLARYAVQLNQAEINRAKVSGQKPPAKLTRTILEDREKIADYLRSHYKFTY